MATINEYRIRIVRVGASSTIAPGSITNNMIAPATIQADRIASGVIPTALPPNGAASGDLAGTYPAPTIKPSVALTGAPTAPTATAGANTTQIATTAFVKSAIDALVAGAPGALDTLAELAAALQNEESLSASFTTALAGKAAINGANVAGADLAAWKTLLGLGALAYLGTIGAAQITDGAVTTPKIADGGVTLAKLEALATQTLIGNPTGSTGAAQAVGLGIGLGWSGNNIVVTGGSAGVGGSGTVNKLAKFTTTTGIGNSALSDDGTAVSSTLPIVLPGAPTANAQAATKAYVDAGLSIKADSSHGHATGDITGLGTAATLNAPASGNAAANEVVKGNDTRITGAATTGKAIAMAIVFGG